MTMTPGSPPPRDKFVQRLDPAVDLHRPPASTASQSALESLREHLRSRRTGAWLGLVVGAPRGQTALTAAWLGKAVGLPVLRVDLAAVVSRYLGETEKNLDRVFEEAGRADAILFFDEADALFGKRSGVQDSHDRHANVDTAYLLRRLDAREGPAVFAASSTANIDPAVLKRLHPIADM